mgnify:FL=1|jgi:hypothetical protein
MSGKLVNRYIWLVDTIRRYGRITRPQIDNCWMRSQLSDGRPMPRRSFANYRRGAEEMFNIEIKCDPSTFEYYIEDDGDDGKTARVTEWLLNSTVTNDVLTNSRDVADRIFLEDVPSARRFLAPVIDALRQHLPVRFDYHSYTRSSPTPGVVLEPYFLKIFRQRWYVTGRNRADKRIKTYALDRMSELSIVADPFRPDPAFDAAAYAAPSFGIIFDGGKTHRVVLRVDPVQAKYLRALPLHPSQHEYVHDGMSLFHYDMRITRDLVDHILSLSPGVIVEKPAQLRDMVIERLINSLDAYESQ